MIAALLLAQTLSPALPVVDPDTACTSDAACLVREADAHARLEESWPARSAGARAHCAAKTITGDITRYAGLEACLIIYHVIGDPGAGETTQARIPLAPVSSGRN